MVLDFFLLVPIVAGDFHGARFNADASGNYLLNSAVLDVSWVIKLFRGRWCFSNEILYDLDIDKWDYIKKKSVHASE